jgi:hypothetical protein
MPGDSSMTGHYGNHECQLRRLDFGKYYRYDFMRFNTPLSLKSNSIM